MPTATSTTASANGIPVLSDVLWILPMLTPGFAQAQPVPPVASAYGVIHLQRATGPSNAIAVTSQRRSYAAGVGLAKSEALAGPLAAAASAAVRIERKPALARRLILDTV